MPLRESFYATSNSSEPSNDFYSYANLESGSPRPETSSFEFPSESYAMQRLFTTSDESYQIMLPNPPERMINLTDEEWQKAQDYVDNPENWPPFRRDLHERIIESSISDCDAMSKRLRSNEIERGDRATIYILRGTCGAGKTTALKSGERFPGVLDEEGRPTGAVATDTLKIPLRHEGFSDEEIPTVTHAQIHQESGMLNRRLTKELHITRACASGE